MISYLNELTNLDFRQIPWDGYLGIAAQVIDEKLIHKSEIFHIKSWGISFIIIIYRGLQIRLIEPVHSL